MKKTIKQIYSEMVQNEWRRLVKDSYHRLEFETTLYFLKKYLPQKGFILDAGGGPGRYTIELAKKGYQMVLVDLTPELLEKARKEIKKAGVKRNVKAIAEGDITNLADFKDDTFDAVLCLGAPLSHVSTEEKRSQAVSELVRVAKSKAPVFISVIGRLGVVSACARYWVNEIGMTKHFREIWKGGNDNIWKKGSYAHMFLPEELDRLVTENGAEIIERVGLEGLVSVLRKEINKIARSNPLAWKNWQESHYKLCTHPAVYATSSHMLIIGKKNA
ncbi:MAG TPA: class I SAM-dependent methyltransferase [Candidatus Bathyarchaeia archaeon]|nr:class I SAM-dependent methyltransferase [Candidatus Bathyarchaeia archaeon]